MNESTQYQTIDIEPAPQKKIEKFRQSGHLSDQKLRYDYPPEREPTLFELISQPTKEKIKAYAHSIEVKAIGIRLTATQDRMLTAINKLLHDKSQHKDPLKENFYDGNAMGQVIEYGGQDQTAKSTFLKIRPTELYKEYLGKDDYSGKEIINAKSVLSELSDKKFLIRYDRKRQVQVGNKMENRTDRIEEFQSLLKVVHYIEDMNDRELRQLNVGIGDVKERKGEILIALNPIITDQIRTKYIEYPVDINRRTIIASGGAYYVTQSINILRDFMLREISAKRSKIEINVCRLPYVLGLSKDIDVGRRKSVLQKTDKAIKVVKNLGIIIDHEVVEGADGQLKHIFTLDPNYE